MQTLSLRVRGFSLCNTTYLQSLDGDDANSPSYDPPLIDHPRRLLISCFAGWFDRFFAISLVKKPHFFAYFFASSLQNQLKI